MIRWQRIYSIHGEFTGGGAGMGLKQPKQLCSLINGTDIR